MIFAFKELRRFLRHAQAHAPVMPVGEWDERSPAILLRHDIDFHLGHALRVAQIEHEEGVRATYFVMTSALWYNALSPTNRDRLRRIAELGMEIGLHFDPSIYSTEDLGELDRHARAEAAALESIVGRPIRSVSIHNPSMHGRYPLLSSFRNAYAPGTFSPQSYLSDSRMIFRSDPFEFVSRARSSAIQILLHPMHFSEEGHDYEGIFVRYIEDHVDDLDSTWKLNSGYAAVMKRSLLSAFCAAHCAEADP